MMKIKVITLFSQMFATPFQEGVVGQALKKELFQMDFINPRDFTSDVHKTVDDRPYGGGDGMVMLVEPLRASIQKARHDLQKSDGGVSSISAPVIYLSPQGKTLNDQKVRELAQKPGLILLSGRYGGVDERLIAKYVDEEISIGDYILSGGELAAMVLIDAVVRQLPGVLGNQQSTEDESFAKGLLEAPQFTRPVAYEEMQVPEILRSGDHAKIQEYRTQLAILRTQQRRPDLLAQLDIAKQDLLKAQKLYESLSSAEKKILGLS